MAFPTPIHPDHDPADPGSARHDAEREAGQGKGDNAPVVRRPAGQSNAELEGARAPGGGPRHGREVRQHEQDIQRESKARP